MIGVRLTFRPSVCMWQKTSNVAFFSDTVNMINAKLCLMVVLIQLYAFLPLSVTLIVLQSHSSVKHFKLKFCSYLMKLKLCMNVDYVN